MNVFEKINAILREVFHLNKQTKELTEEIMATNEKISQMATLINKLSAAVTTLLSGETKDDPAQDSAIDGSLQAGNSALDAFNADQNPPTAPVTTPVDGTPVVPADPNANPTAPGLQ